jgi:membrane fusion protein (multidrug efflux system)
VSLDPKELAEHPLRVGLSMDAKVDVSKTDGRMLADGSRASVSAQTTVFEQNNTAADTEVRRIIAANAGAGFKPTAVASAKPVEKSAVAATTASASASMATLAAGANANAANMK